LITSWARRIVNTHICKFLTALTELTLHDFSEVEELYKRGLFNEGQLIDRKESNEASPTTAKDIRSDEVCHKCESINYV
jgi:hypothetical protein